MQVRGRVGRVATLLVVGTSVTAGLVGCAGSAERSSADRAASAPVGADASGAPGATAGSVGGETAVPAAPREIVSTARMRVVAEDVADASARAEAAAAARGGFVFGEEEGDARGSAVLTIKVPGAAFRPLLADLSELGDVERRAVSTDDVTADGADLDSRIVSAQRSVDRVRGFLEQTKNVAELASIEGELTRRETELEQLQGQRRVLSEQVALATVTLTLTPEPAPAPPAEDGLRAVPGFGGALASALGALVKVGRVGAAGAGYALPFLVVFGLPLVLVRRLVRRRRPTTSGRDGEI